MCHVIRRRDKPISSVSLKMMTNITIQSLVALHLTHAYFITRSCYTSCMARQTVRSFAIWLLTRVAVIVSDLTDSSARIQITLHRTVQIWNLYYEIEFYKCILIA